LPIQPDRKHHCDRCHSAFSQPSAPSSVAQNNPSVSLVDLLGDQHELLWKVAAAVDVEAPGFNDG
jgi:hypothetical protein